MVTGMDCNGKEDSTIEATNMNDNYNVSKYKSVNYNNCFCLYIMFNIVLFLFSCAIYSISNILSFYVSQVDSYFYLLLFTTSFFKILFKFGARKIDTGDITLKSITC